MLRGICCTPMDELELRVVLTAELLAVTYCDL